MRTLNFRLATPLNVTSFTQLYEDNQLTEYLYLNLYLKERHNQNNVPSYKNGDRFGCNPALNLSYYDMFHFFLYRNCS